MLGLKDKVIFVTGGSRGIGAATVAMLEGMGAKVAYVSLNGAGPKGTLHFKADVRKPAEIEKAIHETESKLGPIFGIVANAGINRDRMFSKMTSLEWQQVMDTNLNGVFNTLMPAVPLLYARRAGAIVIVSSIVGERGNIGQVNYSASKSALIGMSKSLAREGARYGVRSNVVAPGFVLTAMVEAIPPDIKEKITAEIPLGRMAQPNEIAWAISFLLSPIAAAFITGEVLRVNGGQHT